MDTTGISLRCIYDRPRADDESIGKRQTRVVAWGIEERNEKGDQRRLPICSLSVLALNHHSGSDGSSVKESASVFDYTFFQDIAEFVYTVSCSFC